MVGQDSLAESVTLAQLALPPAGKRPARVYGSESKIEQNLYGIAFSRTPSLERLCPPQRSFFKQH
jgi:hypothetical protein